MTVRMRVGVRVCSSQRNILYIHPIVTAYSNMLMHRLVVY